MQVFQFYISFSINLWFNLISGKRSWSSNQVQSKRKNWANLEDWENPWISFCYWAWTWTWSIIKYNYSGNSSYNYRRRNHFPKEKKKSHPHWQEQRLPDLWQRWQLMLLDWLLLQIIKKENGTCSYWIHQWCAGLFYQKKKSLKKVPFFVGSMERKWKRK